MTTYFEGNGQSRPVTISECRDQFVHALKEMRDEILNDPSLEAYEDSTERDLVIANRAIGGVLSIVDGNSEHFPGINLIPYVADDDKAEAIAAGANFLDLGEFADFGAGMSEYWIQVNS